eukprot:56947-Eustigmatos_ZCMA.PRE.1
MHISLKEHLTNVEIRQRAGVKAVTDLLRERRLGWFGKVIGMEMDRWPKAVLCGSLVDVGKRPQGHPHLRWTDMVRKDLQDVDVPLEQCIDVCKSNRWNGIRRKGKQVDAPRVVRLWPCGGD